MNLIKDVGSGLKLKPNLKNEDVKMSAQEFLGESKGKNDHIFSINLPQFLDFLKEHVVNQIALLSLIPCFEQMIKKIKTFEQP